MAKPVESPQDSGIERPSARPSKIPAFVTGKASRCRPPADVLVRSRGKKMPKFMQLHLRSAKAWWFAPEKRRKSPRRASPLLSACHQPSARLSGLRQGRRVRAADMRFRRKAGRKRLRRGQVHREETQWSPVVCSNMRLACILCFRCVASAYAGMGGGALGSSMSAQSEHRAPNHEDH